MEARMRRIPVVYYLCRNRHLEHPHFMEVPLSSPEGLYLRDVVRRLNVLRGKGMPAMYSWSCKRSYKNGFVWHDLSEDDLIFSTNGNEFVLKGSELLVQTSLDKVHVHHSGPIGNLQNSSFSQSETPTSSRTNETSSSSSSATFRDSETPSPPSPLRQGEEQCPLAHRPRAPSNAADASTQTDVGGSRINGGLKNTCIRGVSTDDNSIDLEYEKGQSKTGCRDEISPPQPSSSVSSSGRKMETLESLIKADVGKMNRFRVVAQEEILMPTGPRLKATNMLMQLITCGFISVKDHHSSGLVSHMKFPSQKLPNSMILAELDYLCDNPKFIGLRMEDKEYFSGSFLETRKQNEALREGLPTLKRSSSFNADSSNKSSCSRREAESNGESPGLNCLPLSRKITLNKPSKIDMRSRFSDCPRNSSAKPDPDQSSIDGSKRITDVSSVKRASIGLNSLSDDKEKTIKIEERLISGARVIIRSRAPYDDEDSSSS